MKPTIRWAVLIYPNVLDDMGDGALFASGLCSMLEVAEKFLCSDESF